MSKPAKVKAYHKKPLLNQLVLALCAVIFSATAVLILKQMDLSPQVAGAAIEMNSAGQP